MLTWLSLMYGVEIRHHLVHEGERERERERDRVFIHKKNIFLKMYRHTAGSKLRGTR